MFNTAAVFMLATHSHLAPVNLDDWVQIAIIVVVIFGSLISSAGAALAKKFGKKDESVEPRSRPMPPVAAPGPFAFPRPEPPQAPHGGPARTIQERRSTLQGDATAAGRPAVPHRPPVVFKAPQPVAPPARRAAAPPEADRPFQPPKPRPPKTRPPKARPAEPARSAQRPVTTRPAPPTTRVRRDLSETVAEHERQRERMVDQRIGHVHPGVVAPGDDDEIADSPEIASAAAGHRAISLDRRRIREGIILSEILGPPKALRSQ